MIDNEYKNIVNTLLTVGRVYEDPNREGIMRTELPFMFLAIDLAEGFPVLSLRDLPYKTGFNELKVFLSGSNDIRDLWKNGVNFWDKDWGNYLIRKDYDQRPQDLKQAWRDKSDNLYSDDIFSLGNIYPKLMRDFNGEDQLLNAVNRLKSSPYSTKNYVSMWDPSDIGALSPCHNAFEFIMDKGEDMKLNLKFNLSSSDVFLGLPTNIVYYAGLLTLVAKFTGYKTGDLISTMQNVHLYDNALEAAKQIVSLDSKIENKPILKGVREPYEGESFDSYINSIDDWYIEDYHPHPKVSVAMLPYSPKREVDTCTEVSTDEDGSSSTGVVYEYSGTPLGEPWFASGARTIMDPSYSLDKVKAAREELEFYAKKLKKTSGKFYKSIKKFNKKYGKN